MFPYDLFTLSGCDHMVVGFTITYAISVYHHKSCEFEPLYKIMW